MLEQETDRIVEAVGLKTIGQAPTITLREVLASGAPPAVRTFFRADVEAMLLEEYRAATRTSRFNHDHPDVKAAQAGLNSALVMHYVFPRKEFLARLSDAVHLLANFLVRPQWTLTGVVFEKEAAISVESLGRLLNYFAPYGYMKEVLLRYAADRKVSAFTREEFASLLWKIDAAFVRRKSGKELGGVLAPMYEFFGYPGGPGMNPMPLRALIRFFEDKGLTAVATRLEGELAQGAEAMTLEAIEPVLEDVRAGAGEFTSERPPEAKPSDAPASAPPAAGTAAASPVDGPPKALRDVAGAIAEAERRKFIRKIFRQEDEKFTEAIGTLSAMPGWKEASKYIDEIFISNDVDPYSGEAERFIEIVFQQFHPPR